MLDTATASTLTLAKQMLMDLDMKRAETPVRTETLRLLLTTLIEIGWPDSPVAEAAKRTVMGYTAEFEAAGEAEAEQLAARANVRF